MIDPMTSLAFSVYSNKGVYAVLAGSGLSSAAGIKTGWGIMVDLIERVADLNGESIEGDAETWYRTRFENEPNYSELINQLARSASERRNLLRAYFEPTQDEFDQGKKLPTRAHNAIAQLVKKGFIKVILTTNFDRLLEKALEEASITPTVIATRDAISGAMPITHSD